MNNRLAYSNIISVRERTFMGITYGYYVSAKGTLSRDYAIYSNGKTIVSEFKKEWLPKCVQKFIDTHVKTVAVQEDEFTEYRYR